MRALLLGAAIALLCAGTGRADALNVTFSGTLQPSCALSLTTPGTLALSADSTILGSDQPGGIAAVVAIAALGTATVTVNPPTLTAQGTGYVTTGQQLQVAYSGLSGLTGVNQAYTSSTTTFQVAVLAALQVNNRIVNSRGFTAGTFSTQTVVTCS